MNIYRINTTAYSEEDFFILTTLKVEDVVEVINPIVMAERDGESDDYYDNDSLVSALKNRFPHHTIEHYNEFETITI